jgi:hypothetical protein
LHNHFLSDPRLECVLHVPPDVLLPASKQHG